MESENERLRGEIVSRPPVLASQLSLLDTQAGGNECVGKTELEGGGEIISPPKTTGEAQDKPICPHCGSEKVKSNGNKKQKDGTVITGPDGFPLKRFKCNNCGKGF